MKRASAWFVATIQGLALAAAPGCFSESRPYPVRELYGLEPVRAVAAERASHIRAVRVVPVRVVPPFDGVGFVYRTAENKYSVDYYRGFVTSPDRLLTAETVRFLEEAHVAGSVVDARIEVENALELETSVLELYGDYRDHGQAVAVVRARFLLLEDQALGTRVIGDWTKDAHVPFEGSDAAALARALGKAWDQILEKLARELGALSVG